MKRLVAAAVLLLGACQSVKPEPEVRIVEVAVPVAVSCVPPSTPPRPIYRVSVGDIVGAPSADERYRLTAAAFQEREARLAVVEPVVDGCRD